MIKMAECQSQPMQILQRFKQKKLMIENWKIVKKARQLRKKKERRRVKRIEDKERGRKERKRKEKEREK